MDGERADPIDLLLEGKVEQAIETYVDLYVDALLREDLFIGEDLATQLHLCLAAKRDRAISQGSREPEDLSEEVQHIIVGELKRRQLTFDERVVRDHVAAGKSAVRSARERSDKSVAALESEERPWNESEALR